MDDPLDNFPGFGVAGYRSLRGPEVQWLGLGRHITVILGSNNAGKSNVVRLLNEHLMPIYNVVVSGGNDAAVPSFAPRLDESRPSEDGRFQVAWPLDVRAVAQTLTLSEIDSLRTAASLSVADYLTVPLEAPTLAGALTVTPRLAKRVMDESGAIAWNDLSRKTTSNSGGGEIDDTQRVLNWLRRHAIKPPETVFVPPSRSMRTGEAGDQWDFSGLGVIDRLHRMLNPEFDETHLRKQAASLRNDLRVLLEDEELDFGVPHDRTTVNVRLNGEFFPLESLGTGTEHAVLILAARHVYADRLLLLEEPDAHLHPRLQRRLMALLRSAEGAQTVVASHSAHVIDSATDRILSVRLDDGTTRLRSICEPELFDALRGLGYRASDLLQANAVVWVEGPSDRIYLLHWLRAVAPELTEGVDFSIVFYGGSLLARLSAALETPVDPTLVDLWRVNQRMWLLMDSDRGEGDLKPAVQRLKEEIAGSSDKAGTWVTAGYTIENYVPHELLLNSVRTVHPTVIGIVSTSESVDPLTRLAREGGQLLGQADKVAIAMAVTSEPAQLDVLDLRARVEELAAFIRQ